MSDRFDNRGYLVRVVFGRRRRQVYSIPGPVTTRTFRFGYGVSVQAQSLSDAHELLDSILTTRLVEDTWKEPSKSL